MSTSECSDPYSACAGGIAFVSSGDLSLTSVAISSSTAYVRGPGASDPPAGFPSSQLCYTHINCIGWRSQHGGAVLLDSSSTLSIYGSSFADNSAASVSASDCLLASY